MIKIGMLIADRYEVLEKVGTGGMSDVYKAKDHRLNRMVAVKVLKQEFSENATFVSKFRVEAQAAAGLMHPNIVNVYDVGEEKSSYYIIMELVNGITLKKYIEKKGKLSPREAVTVAIQVAIGLAAAHRNHIIHRDIKPQNIIISKEGKVKVTDFGIAKASTSNTITSNVMGSVHYTSPEQARGGFSDEKSDVYSLGVTLFEMLTGRVPYEGDTTVAIALKHIQEPFPDPLVPDLPYSVQQIVLKCCEKSPDMRYQNMEELASDLRRSLNDPDGKFVSRVQDDNMADTRAMSTAEREEIRRKASAGAVEAAQSAPQAAPSAKSGPDMAGEIKNGSGPVKAEDDQEKTAEDQTQEAYGDEEEEGERRLDRIIQVLSIVAILVICAVFVFVIVNRRKAPADKIEETTAPVGTVSGPEDQDSAQNQPDQNADVNTSMVRMPAVIGSSLEEAQKVLENAGLRSEVFYGVSDTYGEGIVMDAGVPEGQEVAAGSTVSLTVARIERVAAPDVTDFAREEAETTLRQTGLTPVVQEEYSDETDAGYVTGQTPEGGAEIPVGSEVTIYVSKGPDLSGLVQVPNLLGMTEQQAASELLKEGLVAGETTVTDTSGRYAPNTVIGQSIEKGEYVEDGTQVDLEISGEPLYSYSEEIKGPLRSEDPDYKEGTPVTLSIVTDGDNSEEILNATTTTFPFQVSLTGISAAKGTLYMTYTNVVEEEASDAGATAEWAAETNVYEESKEIVRKLNFTKE